MPEKIENIELYREQIKSIIVTIDYIFSIWNDIKQRDLEEIKYNWEGKESEIFIGKFLENELYFKKLENLLDIFKGIYDKMTEIE